MEHFIVKKDKVCMSVPNLWKTAWFSRTFERRISTCYWAHKYMQIRSCWHVMIKKRI